MFTFGPVPTYQGDVSFDAGVSDDKRALTLTFSDATVEVGNSPRDTALVVNRMFSLLLPLEGDGGRAEIEFTLQAGIVMSEGSTVTLILSVNGQSTVADFVAEPIEGFVQTLNFAADAPSECRLFVVLLAGRDSQFPGAAAAVSVSSLDAEILPRGPQPAGAVL